MARMTKAQLDEWWGLCGFKEMEFITGFRQIDFSPEDGYQDFVDACDEWWDKLKISEKRNIYNSVYCY
jgi:hypothetical protein